MTTFGLPVDSFSSVSDDSRGADAFEPLPDIAVVPPDDGFYSSDNTTFPDTPRGNAPLQDPNEIIEAAIRLVKAGGSEDFPLYPTQPQSQPPSQRPVIDSHQNLVGCLIPTTGKFKNFDLCKSQKSWRIGRHPTNDLVLPGAKLSNFHCTLAWNGKKGRQSEVILTDNSTNGTWVNSVLCKRATAILRGGSSISLGSQPDVPNDWRFIFRDIEGLSAAHMKQIWAKYDVGHELGTGAFARVHRCIERVTGEEFAVKIIDRNHLRRSHHSEKSIVREIAILERLAHFRHKNIVALREHFEEEDSIYLILELVRGGDLLTYLGKQGALPEQEVRRMAAQICHAIAYIHSQGIAHRDLKPENVMITADEVPSCKVADFGLAKLVESGTFLKTMCGTPAYLAPEVMLRNPTQAYDNKVDSWSLGVIFYCMLTSRAPFSEPFDPRAAPTEQRKYFNERAINWQVLEAMRLSEEGHDFLRHLLAEDPRNRKSVTQMLDHSWIAALVPSDSQFQHPIVDTEFAFTPSPTPTPPPDSTPTTDDACSQSMSTLHLAAAEEEDARRNLSADPIPGLSYLAGEPSDVTRLMPGFFPGGPPQIAEAEGKSWVSVGGGKRKSEFILGGSSSPLSPLPSLPSEEEDEEDGLAAPRSKMKAKSRARPRQVRAKKPPSAGRRGMRARGSLEEAPMRRSMRHVSKAARYA